MDEINVYDKIKQNKRENMDIEETFT